MIDAAGPIYKTPITILLYLTNCPLKSFPLSCRRYRRRRRRRASENEPLAGFYCWHSARRRVHLEWETKISRAQFYYCARHEIEKARERERGSKRSRETGQTVRNFRAEWIVLGSLWLNLNFRRVASLFSMLKVYNLLLLSENGLNMWYFTLWVLHLSKLIA